MLTAGYKQITLAIKKPWSIRAKQISIANPPLRFYTPITDASRITRQRFVNQSKRKTNS
jgi:hypothetical protein